MKFKDYYNQEILYVSESMNLILEGLPIKNFNKNIPSHINKEYFKLRKAEGKTGSYLKKVKWDDILGTFTVFYNVVPTPTLPVKKISKNGKISNTGVYKVEIQFENAKGFLGNRKDFLLLSKKEQTSKIRQMVKDGSIRLHSNDQSWIWQGVWRRSQDNDYNIYPVPKNRMKDNGVWLNRHGKDIYATKHIMEAIGTIPFLVSTIAKMIRDKYSK